MVAILGVLPLLLKTDPFNMLDGSSMIWLCVLYILGGYIKKYDVGKNIKVKKLVTQFILAIVITCASKFLLDYAFFSVLGRVRIRNVLINYVSPTIIISGLTLFLLFIKIDIKKQWIVSLITLLASGSLGVYLIHVNPLVWENVIKNFALKFLDHNMFVFFLKTIASPILIFIVCIAIELLRIQLFRLLRVDKLVNKLDLKLSKKLQL